MPQLTSDEVYPKKNPLTTKQFDDKTPKDEQFQDLYKFIDASKVGLLTTIRPGIGPVSRAMAVARRTGPDLLFIANLHSKKFKDLDHSNEVQVTFQNSNNKDWASITGEATTVSHEDPRIKELCSPKMISWLGSMGVGIHAEAADDPRIVLIEVKAKYISYGMALMSTLGLVKGFGVGLLTGQVAITGVLRELLEEDIELARRQA